MLSNIIVLLIGFSVTAASLDISKLLSDLGPAPTSDPRWTNWQAPGPGDLRSACPGLNTLANHGFINHSGQNLDIPDILTGLASGLNIGADFSLLAAAVALQSTSNPLGGTFNLSSINEHNYPIEHDASISRQDEYFTGNDYSFDPTNWQQYISHFNSLNATDIPTIGAAKYSRYNDSLTRNPDFVYGPQQLFLTYGENALYTQALGGGPPAQGARLDFIRMFFEQEKLPWELGWRPADEPLTLVSIGALALEIIAQSPEPKLPELERATADTYKDVLIAMLGGANLAALTDGISTVLGL